jgi:RHS repeat-associated protein
LRFPGQQYDAATGLHYNYFRDYEPGTGRYVESDPIGLFGGKATYAYVGAGPLRRIDPSGEAVVLLAPLCAGGACQAALTYCATVAGGFLIAAGIIEVADQVTNCPNNRKPANDACYADEEEDDEDPCEE